MKSKRRAPAIPGARQGRPARVPAGTGQAAFFEWTDDAIVQAACDPSFDPVAPYVDSLAQKSRASRGKAAAAAGLLAERPDARAGRNGNAPRGGGFRRPSDFPSIEKLLGSGKPDSRLASTAGVAAGTSKEYQPGSPSTGDPARRGLPDAQLAVESTLPAQSIMDGELCWAMNEVMREWYQTEEGKAVAAHRPRLPLAFFHEIASDEGVDDDQRHTTDGNGNGNDNDHAGNGNNASPRISLSLPPKSENWIGITARAVGLCDHRPLASRRVGTAGSSPVSKSGSGSGIVIPGSRWGVGPGAMPASGSGSGRGPGLESVPGSRQSDSSQRPDDAATGGAAEEERGQHVWRPCFVRESEPDGVLVQWEDGFREQMLLHPHEVFHERWEACGRGGRGGFGSRLDRCAFARRVQRALSRRRDCEALLTYRHYVRCMPVDPAVTGTLQEGPANRAMALALRPFNASAEGNGARARERVRELLAEVTREYQLCISALVFDCNMMNRANIRVR